MQLCFEKKVLKATFDWRETLRTKTSEVNFHVTGNWSNEAFGPIRSRHVCSFDLTVPLLILLTQFVLENKEDASSHRISETQPEHETQNGQNSASSEAYKTSLYNKNDWIQRHKISTIVFKLENMEDISSYRNN